MEILALAASASPAACTTPENARDMPVASNNLTAADFFTLCVLLSKM
jgi:hypothetical protein